MAILKHGNIQLAIGLSWMEPRPATSNFRESKIVREARSLRPIPVGYAQIATRDGLQSGFAYRKEDVDLQSAAAWLATAQSSAVLIERIGSDAYWLCAVEQGAVLPSGDLVGDRDQIATRLGELQMDSAGTDIPYYDNAGVFDSLADAAKIGFAELVGEIEPDSRGMCKPLARRQIKGPILAMAASALVAALVGGSWHAYNAHYSPSEQTGLAAIEHDSNAVALKEEKARLEAKLAQNSIALLDLFVESVYRHPYRAGGWRVLSHEWKNGLLETVWQRQHGTIADLAMHLDSQPWTLNESKGTVSEISELSSPTDEHQTAESLFEEEDQRYRFLDSLASAPGTWTLEHSKSDGNLFPVRKSQLQGSSHSLSSATATTQQILVNPVHITHIRADLSSPIKWSIQGEFYEIDK